MLGASEFDAFDEPGAGAAALLAGVTCPVSVYYGNEEDIWAPPSHAAEMVELAGRQSGLGGLHVEVDSTHGHMFCVTEAGSRHVAERAALLLRRMLSDRKEAPAASSDGLSAMHA